MSASTALSQQLVQHRSRPHHRNGAQVREKWKDSFLHRGGIETLPTIFLIPWHISGYHIANGSYGR